MKIVVVGGGIMGMSIATELALRGDAVTVLEKSVPGAEASSAAAGLLAPQLESKGPGPMLSLCLESRELYPAWVARIEALSKVDAGYRECGVLLSGAREQLEHTARWQRDAGLNAELVDGKLSLPDDYQVDPPKLMRALSVAAANAGATFRTGHVHGLVDYGVDVDSERLMADAVVLAAGAWSSMYVGSRVVQPMKGQMLELRMRVPPFSQTLASEHVYAVSRGDGRIICGSTMERAGFDKRVTAEGIQRILASAIELCPALASAELHSTWAGLRPWTEDELPILGPGLTRGCTLATGHFRNGILLAPVTAQLVAQLVHGESPLLDISPFRFTRFPS